MKLYLDYASQPSSRYPEIGYYQGIYLESVISTPNRIHDQPPTTTTQKTKLIRNHDPKQAPQSVNLIYPYAPSHLLSESCVSSPLLSTI